MKQILSKVSQYLTIMYQKFKSIISEFSPSRETTIRAIKRALHVGIYGALVVFVSMPVNLTDSKKYLTELGIGMATGFLVGIHKFISGYIKYDLKQ